MDCKSRVRSCLPLSIGHYNFQTADVTTHEQTLHSARTMLRLDDLWGAERSQRGIGEYMGVSCSEDADNEMSASLSTTTDPSHSNSPTEPTNDLSEPESAIN